MNRPRQRRLATLVVATALALFNGCVSPNSGLSSIEELTPEQRLWVTEIKKYIDPKELREWLEAAQVGEDGYTMPLAAWPPWLAHLDGGLNPPFDVVRVGRTDWVGVFYFLDFGPGLRESGIEVTDPDAPIGPHAATTLVEWEKGIHFFFSRIPSPPRMPWLDE